ncbi:MAG: gfo/Idh/MocA family oxidoreductase [Nitrospirae bacterium]|nr:MAG: gfo/Idh/MocA family oxidoreductase [Nitrospirota bacterium]
MIQQGTTSRQPEMDAVGLGLIGLGRHGMRYATHLLEGIPYGRLVAVCRRTASQGLAFAQAHGLRFYQDYRELLADPAVHAAIVVVPPELTVAIALEAIRYRKPLLIEKPLAAVSGNARRIVEATTQAHLPIMTAHTLRYEAAIQALKHSGASVGPWQYIVCSNRLERPSSLSGLQGGHQGSPYGTLLEIGVHQLDFVRFLTGDEVRDVFCELDRTESEQRAWVHLTMHQGLPCLLDISRLSASRVTRAEIIGESGQLVADWTTRTLLHISADRSRREERFLPHPTLPRVISAFLEALRTRSSMPVSGLDGLRAVELAEACYQSARTGQRIQLEGPSEGLSEGTGGRV